MENEIKNNALNDFDEKNRLIEIIAGAGGSKKTYYIELKKRLNEIESKNAEIRKILFSLENVSNLISSFTKEILDIFISISKIIISVFNTKYVIFLNNKIYMDIFPFIMFTDTKKIKHFFSIPNNFQTILDDAQKKPELHIHENYSEFFNTVCMPLKKDDQFIGSIYFKIYKNNKFVDIDVHLLQILSNLFIISLENYHYIKESEYLRVLSEKRKEELEKKILEFEETREQLTIVQKSEMINQERNRIALELHDTIAQILLTLGLNIEWCLRKVPIDSEVYQKLKITQNMSQKAIHQLRDTIFELSINPKKAILDLIYDLSKEFEDITHIDVKISTSGESKEYSIYRSKTIYLLIRELLHNVAKHAQANSVEISIKFLKDSTIITVFDNGKGINSKDIKKITSGKTFGLKTMFKKIKELNGSMEINNLEPKGTKVTLSIPDEQDDKNSYN